jgi:hypothetical protein
MPITEADIKAGRDVSGDILKNDRMQANQGVRGHSSAYSPGEAIRNEAALQSSHAITEEMTALQKAARGGFNEEVMTDPRWQAVQAHSPDRSRRIQTGIERQLAAEKAAAEAAK